MLTPAEHARADAFQAWLNADHEKQHPPVQLSLLTDTGGDETRADTKPHPGDPDGLESIGSILHRWVDELYAKQQAAA